MIRPICTLSVDLYDEAYSGYDWRESLGEVEAEVTKPGTVDVKAEMKIVGCYLRAGVVMTSATAISLTSFSTTSQPGNHSIAPATSRSLAS
jgi:hypothetical protein